MSTTPIKFDARRKRPKVVKAPKPQEAFKPSITPGGARPNTTPNPSNIPGLTQRGRTAMQAVGAPFPNLYTFFTGRRLDVKLLEQTARAPPVARSLHQLQLVAFPGFKFKIVPPHGQELDEEHVQELEPKMEELDRRVRTTLLCVQSLYDIMTYGSGIFELTWKEEDGWNVPDVCHRLPAASLRQAPADVFGNKNRYVVGNILKGIVFDKQDNTFLYYQLQNNYGTSGIPIQIPTEQIIHIKDGASPYVDGEPYLQGIVSTIAQLEFVRKRGMQTMARVGSPNKTATVGVPEEYLKSLADSPITSAIPGASNSTADNMLTDLWEYARQIVENQSADEAIAVPKGIELKYENVQVPIGPTEFDEYLVREAIRHFFPTDILETVSQAISTSSAPLLELIKMMVRGWQRTCCTAFETNLWTKFLELNGFEGYRVELTWDDIIPRDQKAEEDATQKKFALHVITLDEAREELGKPPLTPEERAIIIAELQLWKQPAQQPGMGGPGPAPGSGIQPGPEAEFVAPSDNSGNVSGPEQPGEQIAQGMEFQEAYKHIESDHIKLQELYEYVQDPKNILHSETDVALQYKTNMALPDVDTTSKLDKSAQTVLSSTETEVIAALKKAGFFLKTEKQNNMKLNWNCKEEDKSGSGVGSCKEPSKTSKTPKAKSAPKEKATKATKSAVKAQPKEAPVAQPKMDPQDIFRRLTSGGKITPEEHAYVSAIMSGNKPSSQPVAPQPAKTPAQNYLELASKKSDTQKTPVEKTKSTTSGENKTGQPNPQTASTPKGKSDVFNTDTIEMMSPEEEEALNKYTGSLFTPINQYLANGKITDTSHGWKEDEVKASIEHIDNVFEDNASLTAPATVYRGISSRVAQLYISQGATDPGSEIENKTFLSTSVNKDQAAFFSKGYMMEISLPKGSSALSMKGVGIDEEEEILVNRGTTFISKGTRKEGNTTIFMMEAKK
jgi:hypothetical protein